MHHATAEGDEAMRKKNRRNDTFMFGIGISH